MSAEAVEEVKNEEEAKIDNTEIIEETNEEHKLKKTEKQLNKKKQKLK